MKAETLSTLQRSATLVIIMTLASCAPALTPAPTFTPLPSTASPTQTATATPPPTLTPTQTQVPNPWLDILAERAEYRVPEMPIELGAITAQSLEIRPEAKPKDIYNEIVGSMVKQLTLAENDFIWKQVVAERPDWETAPAAINSTNATDFSQMSKEMVKRFLELSGGRMFVKLWPSNEVKLTDFNQPVGFECDEVAQVPSMAGMVVGPTVDNAAQGVYINSDGKLTYRYEATSEGWEQVRNHFTKDFYCSSTMMVLAESLPRGQNLMMVYAESKQYYTDFHVFALDMKNREDFRNWAAWDVGFFKLK